jgi:ankyrin repeat protein
MNFTQLIESKDLQGLKSLTITLNYKEKSKALLLASKEGFSEGVEMLIEAKSDINAKDEFKRTPLHLSILGGFSEIALFLIKHGAGLENTDCYGRTSLHYAVKRNDLEVTKEIVKVHYERKSAFTSWFNVFNIFLNFFSCFSS